MREMLLTSTIIIPASGGLTFHAMKASRFMLIPSSMLSIASAFGFGIVESKLLKLLSFAADADSVQRH